MDNKNENVQLKRMLIVCVCAFLFIIVGIASFLGSLKSKSRNWKSDISSPKKNEKEVEKAEEEQVYPKYIMTSDEIPATLIENMKNQAEDVIKANIAEKWEDEIDYNEYDDNKLSCLLYQRLNNLEYIGYYYSIGKNEDARPHNSIYLIYKVYASVEQLATYALNDTSHWSAYKANVNYYTYVKFDDLQLLENGSGTVNTGEYEVPDSYKNRISVITDIRYGYAVGDSDYLGYTDIMSFENEHLVAHMDEYVYDTRIDETKLFSGEEGDKAGIEKGDESEVIEAAPRYKEE